MKEETSRQKIVKILRYTLPTLISAALIWWLFKAVNFDKVITVIKEGCDFRYIIAMMGITTLSHIIRGGRWGIQLRAAGIKRMPLIAESVSIFGAYALNLIFQSLGEVWRCVYVSRRQKCSLMTVVGTDFGDRISDMIVVVTLGVVAAIVANPAIENFLTHYAVGRDIRALTSDAWIWLCALLVIIGIFVTIFVGKKDNKHLAAAAQGINRIWGGFKVLFTMKELPLYLLLTVGIWTCYFLETYICFFAFPFTRELISQPGMAWGLLPGLVAFVFGSFSMAVPSNGGLGPWNLAVTFALSLYGIKETDGVAFTMVMWSCQAAMLVILGLFSAGYIFYSRHKNHQ